MGGGNDVSNRHHSVKRPGSIVLTAIVVLLGLIQTLLAGRVILRLVRTGSQPRVTTTSTDVVANDAVTVLVPVLNEVGRLGPCLEGLAAQGPEVAAILVIDGGSTDDTIALANKHAERDARVRVIDASPVPADWNGKAWNLQHGLERGAIVTPWVLTIDADVRPRPGLASALVAHAVANDVTVLSGATRQRLSGAAEGLVHPALLTSLVYRYGIPGAATSDPDDVQANGQCMLIRREALDGIGGFVDGRHSVCEDVTIARRLALAGHRVGFAETGDLVEVAMYGSAGEAWTNWPRSLTMRDQYGGHAVSTRLAEVAFVQGLPLVVAAGAALIARRHHYPSGSRASIGGGYPGPRRAVELVIALNRGLVMLRIGVLIGMVRAYERPPVTYWLSPLLDTPVAARLIQSALLRTHTWRGRQITRD